MKVETAEFGRHSEEFAHVIAKEIDAWNSNALDFPHRRPIDLLRKQIGQEQIDRLSSVLRFDKADGFIPGVRSPSVARRAVLADKALRPVDVRDFETVEAFFLERVQKIGAPEAGWIIAPVGRPLLATQDYAHPERDPYLTAAVLALRIVACAGTRCFRGAGGIGAIIQTGVSSRRKIRRENIGKKLERAKGFEPSTPTLARSCSTPELHPHPLDI
jgi:hypothetical protein